MVEDLVAAMLTVIAIRALKSTVKLYKVAGGNGLYILVQPSGALLWRVKFWFRGLEKKLALGRFPEVSLQDARRLRDEAREKLAEGGRPDLGVPAGGTGCPQCEFEYLRSHRRRVHREDGTREQVGCDFKNC